MARMSLPIEFGVESFQYGTTGASRPSHSSLEFAVKKHLQSQKLDKLNGLKAKRSQCPGRGGTLNIPPGTTLTEKQKARIALLFSLNEEQVPAQKWCYNTTNDDK